MFDRFTEDAKQLMNGARLQSQRLSHQYFAPEHMLLALLEQPDCLGSRILRELGQDPRHIQRDLEQLVVRGVAPVNPAAIPFAPSAKKVLELAMQNAQELDHRIIGTGHLLIGLLVVPETIPAGVLAAHGIDPLHVRAMLESSGGGDDVREPALDTTHWRAEVLSSAVKVLRAAGEIEAAIAVEQAMARLE